MKKRKILFATMIVMALLFTGCGMRPSAARPAGMTKDTFNSLMAIWGSDKEGDGFSLLYEDGKLTMTEDWRDVQYVCYEPGPLTRAYGNGWTVSMPLHGEWKDTEIECGDDYVYFGDGRYYSIAPVSSDSAVREMKEYEFAEDITLDPDASSDLRTHYSADGIYRGFFQVGNKTLAGYAVIIHDEFGHSYKLMAAGEGNLFDIKYGMSEMCSTFTLLFDPDESPENF